jgi:hypothetical protein
MAGKQSSALSAHAALRQRVISNMKQNHPDEFIAAERALGMRMSDVEDVVLAGYLDAFSAMSGTGSEPPALVGLDVLRQSLLHAGIPVPEGADLVAWSLSVSRHVSRQSEAAPAARPAPANADPAEVSGGLTGRSQQPEPVQAFTANPAPASQPAPVVPVVTSDDDLDDLFSEPGGYDTTSVPAAVSPPVAQPVSADPPAPTSQPAPVVGSDDDLDDLFSEPGGYGPAPTSQPVGQPEPVQAESVQPAPAPVMGSDDDLDDLFAEPGGYDTTPVPAAVSPPVAQPVSADPPAPVTGSDDDLDDLFAEPGGYGPAPAAHPAAAPVIPVGTNLDDDLDDLFSEPGGYGGTPTPVSQPAHQTTATNSPEPAAQPVPVVSSDDDLDDLFSEPGGYGAAPNRASQPVVQPAPQVETMQPAPAPVVGSDDDLDDLFAEPGGYDTTPVPTAVSQPAAQAVSADPPATTTPMWPDPKADRGPSANATLFAEPLRPQLATPKRRTGARKRGGRMVASVPSRDMPTGADTTATVNPIAVESILAAVAIPRPVFITDLESVAGGTGAVAGWENDMRALKTQAPVRLIGGKPRHRALGSLVLPHGELATAAQEFTRSWWAACMGEYSGGTLYEIAVLLRRNGNDVTSADFKKTVAVLRLNTPRGLVGLIIVTGKDLEAGSETMSGLGDALEVLLRERLALVGVLSTTADRSDEDAITAGVELAGVQRDLPVTTPVVFSRTWEWGDNTSSTMKLLLGG